MSNANDILPKKEDTSVAGGTPQSLVDVGCAPHDPSLYQPDFVWPNTSNENDKYIVPVHVKLNDEPSIDVWIPPNHSKIYDETSMNAWIQQYQRDGFLVIPTAFSTFLANPIKIEAVQQALDDLISGRNEQFAQAIHNRMASSEGPPDFTSGAKIPWIQYEAGMSMEPDILTPSTAPMVRKIMGFTDGYSPVVDTIVHDPNLLKLVSGLLKCSEHIELFQDMALLKPAHGGREKPWHQDKAYFNVAPVEPVVGCWIAIDEATLENGCLRFQRGGHNRGALPHVQERDFQIPDADARMRVGKVVAVPLPPGGMVLFDGLIPHGTPTNHDPHPRRALQFHWTRADIVPFSTTERLRYFGTGHG